jgi:hypothetical protein
MRPIEIASIESILPREFGPSKYVLWSLGVFVFAVGAGSFCAAGQSATSVALTPEPAAAIVQHMVEQNALRAQHLKYFTSQRHYHIEFHGLGRTMSADVHADVTFAAGAGKSFQVIDESGSHILLNHVLHKLLETERDDSHQQSTALTPANYDFSLQGETTENGRPAYIFDVTPKVKNKLLYRGRIWVDAQDYAVVRIEAEPAENPSFWIKSTEIHQAYTKDGEFWLSQSNRSESKTRFGGSAVLTIDYGTYQFERPRDAASQAGATELTVGTSQLTPR